MTFRLWLCKWIHTAIENSEERVVKYNIWLKNEKKLQRQDKKRLNKMLKKLSLKERIEFGVDTGYIERREKQ